MADPREIASPNDICPDLVTEKEFGPHSSRVRDGERLWIFKEHWGAVKFLKIGHLPRFKRQQVSNDKD